MRTVTLAVVCSVAMVTTISGTAQAEALDIDRLVERFVPGPVIEANAPASPPAGFTANTPAGTITLLPLNSATAQLQHTPAGRDTYVDSYRSTTTVFQRENNQSARIVNVLGAANAPQRFDWQVRLPAGGTLMLESDGSVSVIATSASGQRDTIARIDKPWAFDVARKPIPTRYTVDGTQLTQTIDHASPAAGYPAVASILWSWG